MYGADDVMSSAQGGSARSRAFFDFKKQTSFQDLSIPIQASFSTGGEIWTWLYIGKTARLSQEQAANFLNISTNIQFTDKAKLLSEGEVAAIKNTDGRVWGVIIIDSNSVYHGGIIDGVLVEYWLLASSLPNSLPTGTPSIIGALNPGSRLSIDTSSIKDDDNDAGYSPTYQYSWEASNDDGITWNKLTSLDATDNNSNYTLTAAENAKRMRGVVRYIDGRGRSEIVNSSSTVPVGDTYTHQKSRIFFDFDKQTTFQDHGLLIQIALSTGSETNTWAYQGQTARISKDQMIDFASTSKNLLFTEEAKNLSEGEAIAVKNADGQVWAVSIIDSNSRIHGGKVDGALVDYWLLSSALPNSIPTENQHNKNYLSAISGKSLYMVVEGPSWTQAESQATELGGHLVTVNNTEENQFLVDNFSNKSGEYQGLWIGLSDLALENDFRWASGDKSVYRNFVYYEPNGGKYENFVHMWSSNPWGYPVGS